jgi:tetratricopeptide (TPR) repeat protein
MDLRAGQPGRALERLDRVVASQRTGARVLLLRAEVLARVGHFERAEADALRAFEAAPDLPRAVDLLFAIYAAQNKLDEARRSFEEAEAAGVLHGGARVLLGRLYLARGEVDKAQATYERVIQQNPEIAPAKNDLAFMLASRGRDLERALRLAEDAQRALPDSANAADTVGYVYLRLGRHEAALQQLRYAIERAGVDDPSLPTFHYHLGLALSQLARPDEAATHFERALALDPDFPGAADARHQLAARRAAREP